MAALFLNRLTLQTIKTENNCIGCFGKHIVQKTAPVWWSSTAPTPRLAFLGHAKAFSTVEDIQDERKKKKKDGTLFSNIGRKISARIIHVLDEKGNDLGNMHRADVIRLLDERDLRLVVRDANTEPPQYQLMTGIQIHEERLRLRDREKARPKIGPTLMKELTFSSNIGQHDLDTKNKQIQHWIEKKFKVQITIKKGKNTDEPENKMEEIFNQILETMPGIATFSSKPQATKGGKALMCVLCPLTKKEEDGYRETEETQKRDTLKKDHGNDKESNVLHL
ncbi:translation initiation factor IF-3, mitochondrial [Otolemur garnettii]|uniref:Translation initiation factor IF-3, mitochondrial n=1 Tax=Otolemur garnettii TaxID=30611 RepID=H0XBJ0_OTOGA|nr:translation initiation factor IF-3, mitochondrial [Otolemur garnettii]XP_023373524.1 translation initiation factor IF-3, mitochondrial [Otolemur garnettii]XP_023373525.1 translation initiation factor IF-3, mitochondrial [Otolemur garnettii]XP_023373526.1 translation initiation factor IF-3, mitochondrial [Otolemur garnettii]